MSELINRQNCIVRNALLTGASVFALVGAIWASPDAKAASDDAASPTIWIELGGQLERVKSSQEIFTPLFFEDASQAILAPMVNAQLPPHYSIGGEARVTFVPHDSDWVFSASVRYGRSNATKHLHYETKHAVVPFTLSGHLVSAGDSTKDEFGDGQSGLREAHAIVDFKAGKDVGLGLFGGKGTSILSAGVRFAQFISNADVTLHARPIYHSLPTFGVPGSYNFHSNIHQSNKAIVQSRRSAQFVGPELSWDASAPVIGDDSSMAVTLDWGINAAILFGRQRAQIHHQTSGYYFKGILTANKYPSSYENPAVDHNRSRFVTIPNVGGFAGASLKFFNAKVSLGYRADFFFGAMDGGVDTAKRENIGFFGPFASVSVGIGG